MEQRRLLTIEYEEERKAFTQLRDRIGVSRLVERGQAWWPVRGLRTFHNALFQRVIEIKRDLSEDMERDDHSFEPGKPVIFFSEDGEGKVKYGITGIVSYTDGERMVVAISESADAEPRFDAGRKCGVMLSFDETTYRAMFDALDRVMKAKGRLGELRDLFYSRRKAGELTFEPITVSYLNRSQEEGVNKVLHAKDVAIVHGPPGTGKTTTLVEAIFETLRRESQVLVCAQSNMAVDWISEKLVDRGLSVLRIGNPSRVNDKMLGFTYERLFEAHPDYPLLWSVRKAIGELRGTKKHTDSWHQKMDRLKGRATELEYRINADLMGNARVVACTLVGSSHRLLDGMKFSTLFIDEAAQALEAACWIPMKRVGRVVLAGDHCQLPATVKSYEAMKGGLGVSLMERLVENHPEAVVLLNMQYRMHEDIMRFSSGWFYEGGMTAAPEVRHRGILDLDIPMEWVDTSAMGQGRANPGDEEEAHEEIGALAGEEAECYRETEAGESHGRVNRDEAILTLVKLGEYIEKIGGRRVLEEKIDFGLISPYRAQVQFLRKMIRNTPWFKPYRRLITINTVDGFQGQERDVIVLSLVRSNEKGDIGFLRELRRMNVAITRARMKVIIIGNAETLSSHKFYRRLIGYIRRLKTPGIGGLLGAHGLGGGNTGHEAGGEDQNKIDDNEHPEIEDEHVYPAD